MDTLANRSYCASGTWDAMVVAHATMAWGLSMPPMDLATPMLPTDLATYLWSHNGTSAPSLDVDLWAAYLFRITS
jgi:hypothetical protein